MEGGIDWGFAWWILRPIVAVGLGVVAFGAGFALAWYVREFER